MTDLTAVRKVLDRFAEVAAAGGLEGYVEPGDLKLIADARVALGDVADGDLPTDRLVELAEPITSTSPWYWTCTDGISMQTLRYMVSDTGRRIEGPSEVTLYGASPMIDQVVGELSDDWWLAFQAASEPEAQAMAVGYLRRLGHLPDVLGARLVRRDDLPWANKLVVVGRSIGGDQLVAAVAVDMGRHW